jgi:hypothetical protein
MGKHNVYINKKDAVYAKAMGKKVLRCEKAVKQFVNICFDCCGMIKNSAL